MMNPEQFAQWINASTQMIEASKNKVDTAEQLIGAVQTSCIGHGISCELRDAAMKHFDEATRASLSGDPMPVWPPAHLPI